MQKEGLTNSLHIAVDGQQAIDYLQGAGKFADREKFPLPCLVLLDLKLPFVMGLDVLKWIRQRPELSPVVIILSSSQQNADISTAYRLGANAYLVKAPDLGKLQELVRAIRDFWLTHNIPAPSSEGGAVAANLPLSYKNSINSIAYVSKSRPLHENHHVAAR